MFADHIGNLTVELVLASAEVTSIRAVNEPLRGFHSDHRGPHTTVFSLLEAPTNTITVLIY